VTRLRRVLRAYRAYVRAAVAISLQYRIFVFASAGGALLWILILTRVWGAAFAGRSTVAGFTAADTLVYLTANLQAIVINSPLPYIIANRVRSGEVIFDVSRPLGYPGQMLGLQAGQSVVQLAIMLVVAPVAAFIGGLSAPAGLAAGLLYPVALLLGGLLNALLSLLVGLSAFWTVDNGGLATLFRFVATFLAGASVPLTFFPPALQAVAGALPFRFIVYEPAAIYIGQVHGPAVFEAFLRALIWIVVVGVLVALVWRRAFRKMVVHGG
jgi:viologen exporter family transport system permease protein